MDLTFEVMRRNGQVVVVVAGELDLSSAPQLRRQLITLIEDGCRHVVIDIDGATFLDSTGLGVLVGGLKRLRAEHGDLALVCTQGRFLRILKVTGLARVFSVHPTIGSALRAAPLG